MVGLIITSQQCIQWARPMNNVRNFGWAELLLPYKIHQNQNNMTNIPTGVTIYWEKGNKGGNLLQHHHTLHAQQETKMPICTSQVRSSNEVMEYHEDLFEHNTRWRSSDSGMRHITRRGSIVRSLSFFMCSTIWQLKYLSSFAHDGERRDQFSPVMGRGGSSIFLCKIPTISFTLKKLPILGYLQEAYVLL